MNGRCLCGAVRITVETADAASLSACHCDPCRRWAGAVLWGFDAPGDAVTVEGPVGEYRSSSFATRAWCRYCGTQLWFRDDGDAPYELNPGLFDETRDWSLRRVVYADRAAAHARLEGGHARVTKADYEARSQHVDDAEGGV